MKHKSIESAIVCRIILCHVPKSMAVNVYCLFNRLHRSVKEAAPFSHLLNTAYKINMRLGSIQSD